jgi:hypothetical protein
MANVAQRFRRQAQVAATGMTLRSINASRMRVRERHRDGHEMVVAGAVAELAHHHGHFDRLAVLVAR